MLRSLQTLRDTSSADRTLSASGDRLALVGGGDDYATPWHWHDCLMILLPRIGAVDFRDETRKAGAWLSADRFVVVPKTLSHQTAARRPGHDHLALYVTDDALAGIAARLGSISRISARLGAPTFLATSPQMRSLLGLCQACDPADLAARSAREHLTAALLINCLSAMERGEPLTAASPDSHGDALVSELKAYVANNLAADLSLDGIADAFGLSRRHVTRLFRARTGMSIGAFQDRERISRACDLLRSTDLPVGEVAWRVGLDSGSALARMMRRLGEPTPSEARKMARSDTH